MQPIHPSSLLLSDNILVFIRYGTFGLAAALWDNAHDASQIPDNKPRCMKVQILTARIMSEKIEGIQALDVYELSCTYAHLVLAVLLISNMMAILFGPFGKFPPILMSINLKN
jgi:hypothetical protein